MKVTYFVEVISSWCYWAQPTWDELKARYVGRGVEFEWKIALMKPGDFPVSRAQCDWFYRRSGGTVMRAPFMLNSGWLQSGVNGNYDAPSLVAEAGKDFGVTDDRIRCALAHAALREGVAVGAMASAVKVGAGAAKLDPRKLRAAAQSRAVRARVEASTAEFFSHQISQRPAFVLTDAIGDKAVFSGLVRVEPLAATIEAMIADTAAYAAHQAHHGPAPGN
jgi:predicted DsbA family dithiol-disulfide isomerase